MNAVISYEVLYFITGIRQCSVHVCEYMCMGMPRKNKYLYYTFLSHFSVHLVSEVVGGRKEIL